MLTQKSDPKVPKKSAYGKEPQEFQKGGGGVLTLVWKIPKVKLHFMTASLSKKIISVLPNRANRLFTQDKVVGPGKPAYCA